MQPIATTLDQYRIYLRVQRNAAKRTVEGYQYDISLLLRFLGPRYPDVALTAASITVADIEAYLASVMDTTGPRTRNRRLNAFRGLFDYAHRQRLVTENVARQVHLPRVRRSLPDVFSEPEIQALLDVRLAVSDLRARDRAMFMAIYDVGLRTTETLTLDVTDVDLRSGTLVIHEGKGGKDAVMPMSPKTVETLREYLPVRGRILTRQHLNPARNAMFPAQRAPRLTKEGVEDALRRACRRIGITRRVFPHQLRHSYATHLLDHGADLRDVQELMRHEDISTTQIYTHKTVVRIRQAHGLAHPLARGLLSEPGSEGR